MVVTLIGVLIFKLQGRLVCTLSFPSSFRVVDFSFDPHYDFVQILDIERLPRFLNEIVLEGGSIHVDGEGNNIASWSVLSFIYLYHLSKSYDLISSTKQKKTWHLRREPVFKLDTISCQIYVCPFCCKYRTNIRLLN